MKRLFTLILTLTMSICFAQDYVPFQEENLADRFNIEWGDYYKDKTKSTATKFIGSIDGYVYVQKVGKKADYIDKVDSEMNIVATLELNMEFGKNKLDVEEIIFFSNRIFVLSSYANKSKEIRYLFYQELETKSLRLSEDIVKMAEIDYSNGTKRRNGEFIIEQSRDESKLLVLYDVPGKKKDREHFGFHVFDKDLGQIWEAERVFPYQEGLFFVKSYELDNNGDVYVLGNLYDEVAKIAKKGVSNYDMRLLAFTETSEDPKEYKIDLGDLFLTDMSVFIRANEVLCLGFYSNKGYGSVNGCFVSSIDKKTKGVITKNHEEFSLDFIKMYQSAKQQKKTDKKEKKGKEIEMTNLEIRNILVNEKTGDITVIAEEYLYYVTTTQTSGANGTYSTTRTSHYVYNDIILFGISSDYRIEWYDKIPKAQHTTNDGGFYSGFYFVSTEDRMYFVFNDHFLNTKIIDGAATNNFSGNKKTSVAVVVSVSYSGHKGKDKLFNVKDEVILLRPKVCGVTSDNQILVFAQLKKAQRYAKVSREE